MMRTANSNVFVEHIDSKENVFCVWDSVIAK